MGGRDRVRVALVAAVVALCGVLTGAVTTAAPRHHQVTALFFGDSLLVGVGAVPQRPVQVRVAAERLGWAAVVDARGGTGFTTGGSKGRPYLQRLRYDGYLRTRYDVIVLEGGTNDAHHGSLTQLHDAALQTVDHVRSRQPQARVVLVGGFAPPGVPLERYLEADRVLARVASERGLQYVSQVGYSSVTERGFLSRDAYHPSDAGYTLMGTDLAAALER